MGLMLKDGMFARGGSLVVRKDFGGVLDARVHEVVVCL